MPFEREWSFMRSHLQMPLRCSLEPWVPLSASWVPLGCLLGASWVPPGLKQFFVVHADPRLLVVDVDAPFLRIRMISAHAPIAKDLSARATFFKLLSKYVNHANRILSLSMQILGLKTQLAPLNPGLTPTSEMPVNSSLIFSSPPS